MEGEAWPFSTWEMKLGEHPARVQSADREPLARPRLPQEVTDLLLASLGLNDLDHPLP
jgi:hypothetical protein